MADFGICGRCGTLRQKCEECGGEFCECSQFECMAGDDDVIYCSYFCAAEHRDEEEEHDDKEVDDQLIPAQGPATANQSETALMSKGLGDILPAMDEETLTAEYVLTLEKMDDRLDEGELRCFIRECISVNLDHVPPTVTCRECGDDRQAATAYRMGRLLGLLLRGKMK